MQVRNETQSGFAGEIKIVPLWAWALAGIVFVAAQVFFNVVVARHGGGPPVWARPLLGLAAGLGGVCYLLLIGYINRDAKRRGMSPTLWTIMAVIIPNALGIILYFLLRQARSSVARNAATRCRADSTSARAAITNWSQLPAVPARGWRRCCLLSVLRDLAGQSGGASLRVANQAFRLTMLRVAYPRSGHSPGVPDLK